MKPNVNEALELIKKNITPLEPETVEIDEADGRRAAERVTALADYPPFSRSPYDGYAIRSCDAAMGEPFSVIGDSFAGAPFEGKIEKMQAVKIMTGGMIPEGADCVVPWENSDRGEKKVKIYVSPEPFENYIRQGEDFKRGETLLKAGTEISAAEIALAAAGGIDKIKIYRRLRAAVISTGDELTPPGKHLEKGKIYDTNILYVSLRLRELGESIVYKKAVRDDIEALRTSVLEASKKADIIFTTGGVSVGEKDLIPDALEKAGARNVFKGVNIKPGMPTTFSILEGRPVIALSGNPFAAAVGFELFGREALAALSGDRALYPRRAAAVMANEYSKKSGTERYLKASCADGLVSVPDSQGNGSLRSMTGCNCLIRIPAGTECLKAGDVVEVLYV